MRKESKKFDRCNRYNICSRRLQQGGDIMYHVGLFIIPIPLSNIAIFLDLIRSVKSFYH